MCIIVAKYKGYDLPKKSILQNCYESNPDGAGIMYTKNNKVVIDKGYMTFNSLWKRLEKLQAEIDIKNTPIVLHFRIGTSGAFDKSNTHPFELTNQNNKLLKLKNSVNIGIAHNGIITAYEDANDFTLNDTQLFIKKFLYPIYKLDNHFYRSKEIQEIIKNVTSSKFAFLTSQNELILIGDFIKENGIYYSNKTYKESRKKYTKKKKSPIYYKYANYNDYIEELSPLEDDDVAMDEEGNYFINYDYRKAGHLAIDTYSRLFLVDTTTESISLLSNYVDVYSIQELQQYYNKKEDISWK